MGIFDKLFKRGKSQTMFTSFGNSDLASCMTVMATFHWQEIQM